jgi:hypothetical protein
MANKLRGKSKSSCLWKRLIKVYHPFARSQNGLMVQFYPVCLLTFYWRFTAKRSTVSRSPFVVFGNCEIKIATRPCLSPAINQSAINDNGVTAPEEKWKDYMQSFNRTSLGFAGLSPGFLNESDGKRVFSSLISLADLQENMAPMKMLNTS